MLQNFKELIKNRHPVPLTNQNADPLFFPMSPQAFYGPAELFFPFGATKVTTLFYPPKNKPKYLIYFFPPNIRRAIITSLHKPCRYPLFTHPSNELALKAAANVKGFFLVSKQKVVEILNIFWDE